MRSDYSSIRARLVLGAALVLLAFMAVAGVAVQRAHADSVRAAHFARLQSTVYLLLAGAELDDGGALVMPPALAEPRLSLPGSGLYASIVNVDRRRGVAVGVHRGAQPAVSRAACRRASGATTTVRRHGRRASWRSSYGVELGGPATPRRRWCFRCWRTRRSSIARWASSSARCGRWLGGAGLLLLLSQTLLLRWGLAPLQRVAQEIARIESGEQAEVEGRYPTEIAALTGNLNTLIKQERVRQTRYKEALSFLAHSLKTPLAVLRTALDEPAQLPAAVAQQVSAHGRHRAAPARPRGRQRRRALRAVPGAGAGARSHPRFAGQGLCGQGPGVHGRLPARPELAHRRGRCLRDAGQRDGQRGQVGAGTASPCAPGARRDAPAHPRRGRRAGLQRHRSPSCSCTCAWTNRCRATASAWRWSTTWWPATRAS